MVNLLISLGRKAARVFNGLALQIRIVVALADRDFILRAEKGPFGVWGVVFEPLALMLTLLAQLLPLPSLLVPLTQSNLPSLLLS